MATIILESKEKFEHYHSGESSTELISGKLLYHCDGETIVMKKGVLITTPPNKSHIIENINNGKSKFGCGHGWM